MIEELGEIAGALGEAVGEWIWDVGEIAAEWLFGGEEDKEERSGDQPGPPAKPLYEQRPPR